MQRRVLNGRSRRSAVVVVALLGLLAAVGGGIQRASAQPAVGVRLGPEAVPTAPAAKLGGNPIVVGSTLSLTGAFAATGIIHKAAGETFVRWINATAACSAVRSSGRSSTTSPIRPRSPRSTSG